MPSLSSLCCVLPSLGCFFLWLRLRRLGWQVGRLEEISVYDPQTGLRSGRLFENECAILCRGPNPVAVLLIDLDDFRRYNERGYREAGDQALKKAADVLSKTLRKADRLYRLHTAGDEFVCCFAVRTARDAYRQAERLRGALSVAQIPGSVGIAFAKTAEKRDPAHLLQIAAQNKDEAKKQGGNAIFPTPDDPPVARLPTPDDFDAATWPGVQ